MTSLLNVIFFLTISIQANSFSLDLKSDRDFSNQLLHGEHFFILKDKISSRLEANPHTKNSEDCRSRISQVICLAEPTLEGQDPQSRTCLEGSKAYAHYFEELYDRYPITIQKLFCSVKSIFVEKSFFGTAYAAMLVDADGKMNGYIMGIRQSILDEQIDLKTWASWKEQLSFGGVSNAYQTKPNLPLIETQGSNQDLLYFIFSHEFGHVFDFANDLNQTVSCEKADHTTEPDCLMAENSWGAISWISPLKAKPEFDFSKREQLCFYSCNNTFVSQEDISKLYSDFVKTNFISLYSATQPWDDFAESFAYYLMWKNLKTPYFVNTQQGMQLDVIDQLNSPRFAEKYNYIDNLLKNKNLKYP